MPLISMVKVKVLISPSISNRPPLDILKITVTKLSNQDKKVAFIRVDEYVALARSYGFMKTCRSMSIMVHNTGVYAYSLDGKS